MKIFGRVVRKRGRVQQQESKGQRIPSRHCMITEISQK